MLATTRSDTFNIVAAAKHCDNHTEQVPILASTTSQQNSPSSSQHNRSLSLSLITSPLDALALACAAEQSSFESIDDLVRAPDKLRVNQMHSSASGNFSLNNGAIEAQYDDNHDEWQHVSNNTVLGTEHATMSSSVHISVNDVLCGRGGLTNHHPGNVFFRRLVRNRQEGYLRASKRDKANVAREIVDTIRCLDPPGRFLKKISEHSDVWVDIGNRKAREKTSQALREGAPELRGELSLKQELCYSASESYSHSSMDFREQENPTQTAERPFLGGIVSTNGVYNITDAHSPTLEIASPRPRVVSSDSVRSTSSKNLSNFASTHTPPNCSKLINIPSLEHFLPKRQKIYHRSLSDSYGMDARSEMHVSCLENSSLGNAPEQTSNCTEKERGPRLKMLKARFQHRSHEA